MRRLNIAALFALSIIAAGCGSAHKDNPADPSVEGMTPNGIDAAPSAQDLGDAASSARVITLGDKFNAQSKEKKVKGANYSAGNYKIDGGCGLIAELAIAMTPAQNEKQDLTFGASTEAMGELRHLNKAEKKKAISLALRMQKQAQKLEAMCKKSKNVWGGKQASEALVKLMQQYNDSLVERKVEVKKEAAKKPAAKAKKAAHKEMSVDASLIEIENEPTPAPAPAADLGPVYGPVQGPVFGPQPAPLVYDSIEPMQDGEENASFLMTE